MAPVVAGSTGRPAGFTGGGVETLAEGPAVGSVDGSVAPAAVAGSTGRPAGFTGGGVETLAEGSAVGSVDGSVAPAAVAGVTACVEAALARFGRRLE